MDNNPKSFQQKVKNRKFAIDNSWRGQQTDASKADIVLSEEARLWNALEDNLSEADAYKFNDGNFPIYSNRKKIGRILVFLKRGVRKLLKVFLGWYMFPIFHRQSHFNGKIVNITALERELIIKLENRVNKLEEKNQQLREEIRGIISQETAEADKRNRDEIQTIIIRAAEADKQNKDEIQRIISQTAEADKLTRDELTALQTSLRKLENLPTSDDDFYHHFEERFRGAREEIKARLQVYVPIIKEYLQDWATARFVDIGSGRGEWLDILKENGATDYVGIDLNARQNAIAESYGHKTLCRDCIEYLAEQQDESVDLISGIQIIEHLCMSDLMELLKQCHRVLKKGGMILFETPNPRNVMVGADTFYIDPSHKRALDPGMATFFAEWTGFIDVKCIDVNSNPLWEGIPLPEADTKEFELVKQFNDIKWLLYGPMDYALFAVKE